MTSASADSLAHVDTAAAAAGQRQRYLRACVRDLESCSWQQRVAPVAQALVDKGLVRSRNEHSAPQRYLNAQLLQKTLCHLLSAGDENALLVFEAFAVGMDPECLAADRGVTMPVLAVQLRDALEWVAAAYEGRTNGDRGQQRRSTAVTNPCEPQS